MVKSLSKLLKDEQIIKKRNTGDAILEVKIRNALRTDARLIWIRKSLLIIIIIMLVIYLVNLGVLVLLVFSQYAYSYVMTLICGFVYNITGIIIIFHIYNYESSSGCGIYTIFLALVWFMTIFNVISIFILMAFVFYDNLFIAERVSLYRLNFHWMDFIWCCLLFFIYLIYLILALNQHNQEASLLKYRRDIQYIKKSINLEDETVSVNSLGSIVSVASVLENEKKKSLLKRVFSVFVSTKSEKELKKRREEEKERKREENEERVTKSIEALRITNSWNERKADKNIHKTNNQEQEKTQSNNSTSTLESIVNTKEDNLDDATNELKATILTTSVKDDDDDEDEYEDRYEEDDENNDESNEPDNMA